MTARHTKKDQPPSTDQSADSPASIEARRHERWREIWISFWMSLAITGVMILIKLQIEKTDFGKQIESMSYDLLQHHLSAPATIHDLPVIVLDISGIEMRPTLGSQPALVTDRAPLRSIVEQLVKLPNPPKAIGLDVDFSPDSHGYAHPDDPSLFDFFLSQKIPITIGVNSSLALGPQRWLNDPKYIDLASCVVVPKPDQGQSTRYMPEETVVNYPTPMSRGIDEHCSSMAFALEYDTVKNFSSGLGWFVDTSRVKSDRQVTNSEFLVDYSPLQLLASSPPDALNPDELAKADLKDKIVLLGRTKNTTDTFTVPGKPEQPYAGVFLHACAIYTMENRPLYRLTDSGRIAIDFLFSLIIFGPFLLYRLSRHKQGKEVVVEHRFVGRLINFEALLLVVFAVWLVRYTHLMWDDFLLVAIVLVAHAPIEHATVGIGRWLDESLRSGRHASPPSSGPPSEGE